MSIRKYVRSVPANETKIAPQPRLAVVYAADECSEVEEFRYVRKYHATATVSLDYWVREGACQAERDAKFRGAVTALNRGLYAKVYGLMNELGHALASDDMDEALRLHDCILKEMYE